MTEARQFLKRLDLDLPTYYDPDDMTRAAVDQVIGFEGFPTTVIYDAKGHERARLSGAADWNSPDARAVVEALMGEH